MKVEKLHDALIYGCAPVLGGLGARFIGSSLVLLAPQTLLVALLGASFIPRKALVTMQRLWPKKAGDRRTTEPKR